MCFKHRRDPIKEIYCERECVCAHTLNPFSLSAIDLWCGGANGVRVLPPRAPPEGGTREGLHTCVRTPHDPFRRQARARGRGCHVSSSREEAAVFKHWRQRQGGDCHGRCGHGSCRRRHRQACGGALCQGACYRAHKTCAFSSSSPAPPSFLFSAFVRASRCLHACGV